MRTSVELAILSSLIFLVHPLLRGDDPKPSANATAYPHGTTTCIGGENGPGVRLFLRQFSQCQGTTSYPYLRIDIREQPILAKKNIAIGGENTASRCLSAGQPCQQAVSGDILFDHFKELSGGTLKTNGYYDLKFKSGRGEGGLFTVDCMAPCS